MTQPTRAAYLQYHQSHLAWAEDTHKHVATRTWHSNMALMYYQLYKDAPRDEYTQ